MEIKNENYSLNKRSYKSFQVSPGTMHLFVNEIFNIFVVVWLAVLWIQTNESAYAQTSFFFPPELMNKARVNTHKYHWGKETLKNIIDRSKPWIELSDDELWSLMFSHTLERAWMVWSDGHCPACKKDVVMYNWKIQNHYIQIFIAILKTVFFEIP